MAGTWANQRNFFLRGSGLGPAEWRPFRARARIVKTHQMASRRAPSVPGGIGSTDEQKRGGGPFCAMGAHRGRPGGAPVRKSVGRGRSRNRLPCGRPAGVRTLRKPHFRFPRFAARIHKPRACPDGRGAADALPGAVQPGGCGAGFGRLDSRRKGSGEAGGSVIYLPSDHSPACRLFGSNHQPTLCFR